LPYRPFVILFILFPVPSIILAQEYQGAIAETKPLALILAELEEVKGVFFSYEASLLDDLIVNEPNKLEERIGKVLQRILTPLGLYYEKVGRKNFVIKAHKENRHLASSLNEDFPLRQGELKISGQLTDEQNKPLAGGALFILGTNQGTVTDEEGFFQLTVPHDQATIRVSYLGYKDQFIQIRQGGRKNIQLTATTNTLTEVVVTALGISKEKKQLAFATDNISATDLNHNNAYNLIDALAAQSPGIWTNSSAGSPGASTAIRIRGFRSINGANQPLFILDGMPIDNSSTGNSTTGVDISNRLLDLNIQDIEKISVLRGASAAALYGIRAANGAIVITSKKGQRGPAQFSFQTSLGINRVSQLPARQNLYSQGVYADGKAVYRGPESNVNTSYGPLISTLEFDGATDYPYDQNGRLVPKGIGIGKDAHTYDPYKTFFVNGWVNQQHLSVKGGSQLLLYYLSLGHVKESGIAPGATYERSSAKGVFEFNPHEKLSIRLMPTVAMAKAIRMKKGSLLSGIPLALFRSPNTFDLGNGLSGHEAAKTPSVYELSNGEQRAYRANGSYDNPFWAINHNPYQDKVVRSIQQMSIDYALGPGLSLTYRIGADHYTDRRKDAFDIYSGSHPSGLLKWTDIRFLQFNSGLLVNWKKQLNKKWKLSATLGHDYYQSRMNVEETEGDELQQPGVFILSNAFQLSLEEAVFQKKIAGVFADIHLDYHNRLFLNFSGRNDWSSTLPQHNNSFFYPGIHIGLDMTPWLKRIPKLVYSKFRISYSTTGNDASTYLTDTYFSAASIDGDDLLPDLNFPAFGITAFERSTTLGNDNLRPERAHNFEIGSELKWWDSRLNLNLTWYKAIVRGQIINAELSAASGYLLSPINAGTIENQGWEINLSGKWIHAKDWSWQSSINFTQFRSLVTALTPGIPSIMLGSYSSLSSMIIEGQPYGVFVGTSIKRNTEGERVIDEAGFPLLNDQHTIIGDPNPDWLMSIQNILRYKGFALNMQWDIRKGGDIWNGTKGVLSYLGVSKESGEQREADAVVFEGVTESGEPNTKAVSLADPSAGMSGIYWRRYGFLGLAEDHIEDASWLRLRELSFSYRFTLPWKQAQPPECLVALQGHNLLLFTPYSGIDPETNLRGDSNIIGWDYFNMPGVKGCSLKLHIDF